MTSNTLHCHLCQVVLADESTIKKHISSRHLNYRPYDCSTCNDEDRSFSAATEEDMDGHIAASHSAINSGYHVNKDQTKETELKAAIKEWRRVSTSQLYSAEATVDCHLYPALDRPADIDENDRVTLDSKEHVRSVLISLGGTSTDSGNILTEMMTEIIDNSETSADVALECARPEVEESYNSSGIDQTLLETMQDLADRPALSDCQATLLPVLDQPSDTEQNNVQYSMDSSASGDVKAPVFEIPPLQRSNGHKKKFGSRASRCPTVPKEHLQKEGSALKSCLRGKKRPLDLGSVLSNSEDSKDLIVKRKRGRPSRKEHSLPRIQRSKSVTLAESGQNLQQCGIGESKLFVPRKRGRPLRTEHSLPRIQRTKSVPVGKETRINKASKKEEDCYSESDQFSNLKEKVLHECDQCSYSSIKSAQLLIHMRSHDGIKIHECDQCPYVTDKLSHLKRHMAQHTRQNQKAENRQRKYSKKVSTVRKSGNGRVSKRINRRVQKCDQCPYTTNKGWNLKIHKCQHTGEKPFKCDQCSFAAIQKVNLEAHIRIYHA